MTALHICGPFLLAITPLVLSAMTAGQEPVAQVSTPVTQAVVFQDITQHAGIHFLHINGATPEKYMPETMGSGALFFDYNNDGWVDIYLVNGGSLVDAQLSRRARSALYRNNGDGTFTDVTAQSGIENHSYGMGACAADYDNDGWVDLYLTSFGRNILYHNNGDGTFTDVTEKAGVGLSSWSTSCAFGDIDNDGFVDLFVTNYVDFALNNNKYCGDHMHNIRAYCHPNVYNGLPNVLYRNNGDGTFTDIIRKAGLYTTAGKGMGVVFGDYNNDGWIDIYVANDSVPNFLYRNRGHGTFEEVGMWAGVAVGADGQSRAGMGTDMGDYDNDGLLDIIVTNLDMQTHNLYHNMGQGMFSDVTFESGVGEASMPFVGFGVTFFDYDNDGKLDVVVANGNVLDNAKYFRDNATYAQRKLLFHNEGKGTFKEVGLSSGPGFALEKVGRGLAVGDIDNDGYLDLLITNNGQTADLLRNDGGSRNNALLVRTIGTKSNRDGIGARLKLTVGSTSQIAEVKAGSSYLSQSDMRVHFGLGQALRVDRLELRWPSGTIDVMNNLEVNQILTVFEGKGIVRQEPFRTPKAQFGPPPKESDPAGRGGSKSLPSKVGNKESSGKPGR